MVLCNLIRALRSGSCGKNSRSEHQTRVVGNEEWEGGKGRGEDVRCGRVWRVNRECGSEGVQVC